MRGRNFFLSFIHFFLETSTRFVCGKNLGLKPSEAFGSTFAHKNGHKTPCNIHRSNPITRLYRPVRKLCHGPRESAARAYIFTVIWCSVEADLAPLHRCFSF